MLSRSSICYKEFNVCYRSSKTTDLYKPFRHAVTTSPFINPPNIQNTRDNMDVQFPERLGRCLVSDGRYNDAERSYTQMMEMRKRVWGGASIHPEERQQPGIGLQ